MQRSNDHDSRKSTYIEKLAQDTPKTQSKITRKLVVSSLILKGTQWGFEPEFIHLKNMVFFILITYSNIYEFKELKMWEPKYFTIESGARKAPILQV